MVLYVEFASLGRGVEGRKLCAGRSQAAAASVCIERPQMHSSVRSNQAPNSRAPSQLARLNCYVHK